MVTLNGLNVTKRVCATQRCLKTEHVQPSYHDDVFLMFLPQKIFEGKEKSISKLLNIRSSLLTMPTNQREKDNKFNQKTNLITCQCVFPQAMALIQDNLSASRLNFSHNFTWKGVVRTRRIDILWNIFLHVVDVCVTRTVNACVLVG